MNNILQNYYILHDEIMATCFELVQQHEDIITLNETKMKETNKLEKRLNLSRCIIKEKTNISNTNN